MTTSQEYFDPYLTQVITEEKFIYQGLQNDQILKRIKALAIYLSKIKKLSENEEKSKIIQTLIFLFENKNILDENGVNFKANVICIFCDLMKILMSQNLFNEKVMIFYFKLITNLIAYFLKNIFTIQQDLELKFEYILDCMAKTNLLSILHDLKFEKIHKIVINLMKIQSDKKYAKNSTNFQNILQIIKGLLDDTKEIDIKIINSILMNYDKTINKDVYLLSKCILIELKNLLGNPINLVTYKIAKGEEKPFEIYKLTEYNFINLFKFLFSISNEFLLSFLSTFPQNGSLIKEKIKGTNLLHIIVALISSKNSFYIARDYKVLFDNYLSCFNQKGVTENTKFIMFQSLIKFLYKNNDESLKNIESITRVYDVLDVYFHSLKVEENIINSLEFIKEKFLKNKEIPIKVLDLTQFYAQQKISWNQQLILINFNSALLENRFLRFVSIFDYFNDENIAKIESFSFLFNNLIKCIDEKSSKDIKLKYRVLDNLFDFFYSDSNLNEINNFTKTLFALFLITKNSIDSSNIFIKFLKESIDIYMNITGKGEKNIITDTKLNEELKSITEKFKKEENKEILKNLYNVSTSPQERKKLIEQISKSCEVSDEEIFLLKRSILLFIPLTELDNLIDLGNSLITQYEDTTKKSHLLNFLSTELSVFFYSTRIIINSFKTCGEQETVNYRNIIEKILNFLKKLINYKLVNTNILDFIMLILREDLLIKENEIQDKINALILNEILELSISLKGIDLKNIVKLYLEYRSNNPELEILPSFFDNYFFKESKNLYCLKFANEILKIPKGVNEFKEIIFQEKYRKFVTHDMMQICQIKIYEIVNSIKDENSKSNSEDNLSIEYYINNEIECLIYEMFYILFENQSSFEVFQKKLFRIMYNLSCKENLIDEKINNIELCKIFNIIVKQVKYLHLKASRQIKLINLALYENIEVRRHILSKINTFFNKINRKTFYFFNHISIITISFVCLGDPDKNMVRSAVDIITKFFEICRIKYQICDLKLKDKNEDLSVQNTSGLARYIPENYVGVFIMFFVFNLNLHLFYLQNDKKHFEKIIKTFFKILSKNKNEFDSELLIKNIISIRRTNLNNRKIFLKVPIETYYKNQINFNEAKPDLQRVKNEICDLMIKLIRESFSFSEKKYENAQLYCPAIFLSLDNNQNLFKSNIIEKTEEKPKFSQRIDDNVKRELFPLDENINNQFSDKVMQSSIENQKNQESNISFEKSQKPFKEIIDSQNSVNLKRKSRENKKNEKKKSKK